MPANGSAWSDITGELKLHTARHVRARARPATCATRQARPAAWQKRVGQASSQAVWLRLHAAPCHTAGQPTRGTGAGTTDEVLRSADKGG
jgi:hypothetical protein